MAYNLSGDDWSKSDIQEEALKDYSKAIELDPADADAYDDRAFLHSHNRDMCTD